MPCIAFASAKASPGVTTAIAALAVSWPDDRALHIVELDPSGGDLAVRFDLAPEPGLVTLAAAGRRGLDQATLLEHTQALPLPSLSGQATAPIRRVLVGPVGSEQAVAALSSLRGGLHKALASLDSDVLIDCGRLDPGSPVDEIVSHADLLVVVARPVVAEVHHLTTRLTTLRPKALSLLLVGDRPYSVGEVAATIGATPLASFPYDPRAAVTLAAGLHTASGPVRRSRLLRSARSLAEGLADWLAATADGARRARPPAPPPPQAPVPPAPRSEAGPQAWDPAPPPPPPPPHLPTAAGHASTATAAPFPPLPAPPTGAPPTSPGPTAFSAVAPPPPRHLRRDSEGIRR